MDISFQKSALKAMLLVLLTLALVVSTLYLFQSGPSSSAPSRRRLSGHPQSRRDNIEPLSAVDPCEGIVCENGGQCQVVSWTHHCDCPDQYSGEHCEIHCPKPRADAGPDVILSGPPPYGTVRLQADRSDTGGSPASFTWNFLKVPAHSELDDSNLFRAGDDVFFIPDTDGIYYVKLYVYTDCGTSYDLLQVRINENAVDDESSGDVNDGEITEEEQEHCGIPLVEAGRDKVMPGKGPWKGLPLDVPEQFRAEDYYYLWEVVDRPERSEGRIENPSRPRTVFIPDYSGKYEIQITIINSCGDTASDVFHVLVGNYCEDPTARASLISRSLNEEGLYDVQMSAAESTPGIDDGEQMDIRWEFENIPTGVQLDSSAIHVRNNGTAASFVTDDPGIYRVVVSVTDSCGTDLAYIEIPIYEDHEEDTLCRVPHSHPGYDEVVVVSHLGRVIYLDGTNSHDPDRRHIQFLWSFVHVPRSSGLGDISFASATDSKTWFKPDVYGLYSVSLTVTNDCGLHETNTVNIRVTDSACGVVEADAGSNQFVTFNNNVWPTVILDGSGSFDEHGNTIGYHWTLVNTPDNSRITDDAVRDSRKKVATFVPDVVGIYTFELSILSDGCGEGIRDQVDIICRCEDILADAGEDVYRDQVTHRPVCLDAGKSSSLSGADELDFAWELVEKPLGSSILSVIPGVDFHTSGAGLCFNPDVYGEFVFEVKVWRDCAGGRDIVRDTVSVFVGDIGEECQVPQSKMPESQVIEVKSAGSPVFLDGTASEVYGQHGVEFVWQVTSVPFGSAVSDDDISDTSGLGTYMSSALFRPDVEGDYSISLVVSTGCGRDKDSAVYTVKWKGEEDDGPLCRTPRAMAVEYQDVVIPEGEIVDVKPIFIDGKDSYDLDHRPLTFQWKFLSVPFDSFVTNDFILNADSEEAVLEVDVVGEYVLVLKVTNDCGESDSVHTRIKVRHSSCLKPIAHAGDDLDIEWAGQGTSMLKLDASQSYDEGGRPLRYKWRLKSMPRSSSKHSRSIEFRESNHASFVPDVHGNYIFEVTVRNDCGESATDQVVAHVLCPDTTAYAGDDQTYYRNGPVSHVTLDGSKSFSSGASSVNLLMYSWEFVEVPEGSLLHTATLEGNYASKTTFAPDMHGTYVLQLTVHNGCSQDVDRVVIRVLNSSEDDGSGGACPLPSANAGQDMHFHLGHAFRPMYLDGTMSGGLGPETTIKWRFVQTPSGSLSQIVRADDIEAEFMPDSTGEYRIELSLSNKCGRTTDLVSLFVNV